MIDLCRSILDVDFKKFKSQFNVEKYYYFNTLFKRSIKPCVLYAIYIFFLMLNGVAVKFEYRNSTIPIFVILILFIAPSYPTVILMYKNIKYKRSVLTHVTDGTKYYHAWKDKILSSKYIELVELLLIKKYNLMTSNEYQKVKANYIQQNKKVITTNPKEMFMYAHTEKEYVTKFGQSSIDNQSFVTIVELRNTLEINDEEFDVLKSNFINNHLLADLDDLESLKRLEIINESEYYRKLYNQELQLRLRRKWADRVSISYVIICSIIGGITFIMSVS